MLYSILQSFVKVGLQWYVTDWQLAKLNQVDFKRPTLIVSNHPNSFFDAVIIAALAPTKICFLARGDVFNKPLANWALRTFFMLPIYKRYDDTESHVKNAFTYDDCVRQLNEGVSIFIFPEGISRNQFKLGPFMPAGVTSIITRAIQMDVPIQIQPYVIGYNSFNQLPKTVSLETLQPIDCTDYIQNGEVQTAAILHKLKNSMLAAATGRASEPTPSLTKSNQWMRIPALIGGLTHNWYYQLIKKKVQTKTQGTIFFDSLLFGILLFSYPVIVLVLGIILGSILGFWWGVFVFMLFPALSYCWVHYHKIETDQQEEEGRVNVLN